jgi:transposase
MASQIGRPVLSAVERAQLLALVDGSEDSDDRIGRRAWMVLKAAEGTSKLKIATDLGTAPSRVRTWLKRFESDRVGGLADRPRSGAPKAELVITDDERKELERYVRRETSSQRLALRSRIVLRCADGLTNQDVAGEIGVNPSTVAKWRRRFVVDRLDGLHDQDRPGAKLKITDETVEELIVATIETMPKGRSHWSTRAMAKNIGISHSSVGRIWRAFELKPHRTKTFQLSTDPLFIEKVRDVVGLYMNPPDNALVLSVDEKSQIQALNRTQPLLPLRPGQAERGTPEYERNGTTSLFAALDIATGKVIGKCYARHRAAEFRKFLNVIKSEVPANLDVHLICDNYSTHNTPSIKRWLARNQRFQMHFTPTHASWLNQVEGWFSILTTQQLKRASHHSVNELVGAIHQFLDAHNEEPKPFKWTKSADQILASVAAFCYRTLEAHSENGDTPVGEPDGGSTVDGGRN